MITLEIIQLGYKKVFFFPLTNDDWNLFLLVIGLATVWYQ